MLYNKQKYNMRTNIQSTIYTNTQLYNIYHALYVKQYLRLRNNTMYTNAMHIIQLKKSNAIYTHTNRQNIKINKYIYKYNIFNTYNRIQIYTQYIRIYNNLSE